MPTVAQKFWPSTTDHDGTWGTDVRKLLDAASGAENSTTKADFSTDTSLRTIVFDPFTTVTSATDPLSSDAGWAVNASGSDGMEGTATARRLIPSGTWTFNVRASVTVAQSGVGNDFSTFSAHVYKVSSSGTRTLEWSASDAAIPIAGITGVATAELNWTATARPEIELAAGETIHVGFSVQSVGIAVSGQVISLHTRGDSGTDVQNTWVQVPSPGVRTRHYETVTVTGVGTAARGNLSSAHAVTVSGVGTAAMARQTVASKSVTVTGVGTVSRTANVTLNTITATGVGTVNGRVEMPLGRVPDIGGIAVQPLIVVDDYPPLP